VAKIFVTLEFPHVEDDISPRAAEVPKIYTFFVPIISLKSAPAVGPSEIGSSQKLD